ncbi:MAG: exodeoxyribonuclease VII large subunit [Terriglobales bacterium]
MSLPDQLGFTFQAPARRIWTVKALMSAVRTAVEREYTDVFVEGEISNYRPAESRHLYFTLKEDGAQMRVVMFRSQARLLKFKPTDGMAVIARGRVTVYESRGELQLAAEYLEPKGAGALQIAFEQLKQKLAAEGLFDPARKKPIPALPRRVGVVTSPRGAAIRDIVNIVRRRHRALNLLIYPAQVQGDAAPGEVSAGIRYFNRAKNVDVIVVARGGGSMEDLAAFNDEGLARVAAASRVPLISAIGHETDFTILDFVADLRAPTPSAAAELVIESQHQLEQRVAGLRHRLAQAARYHVVIGKQRLTEVAQHRAFARMQDLINARQQRVDELLYRLAAAERRRLQDFGRRLATVSARLHARDLRRIVELMRRDIETRTVALTSSARATLQRKRATLDALRGRLEALSPLSILERGYALVFDNSGKLIKDARQVSPGDEIRARLARGEIDATVKKISR